LEMFAVSRGGRVVGFGPRVVLFDSFGPAIQYRSFELSFLPQGVLIVFIMAPRRQVYKTKLDF